MIRRAFEPYIDPTLQQRVSAADAAWRREAETILNEQIGAEQIAALQRRANLQRERVREEVADINRALAECVKGIRLPPVEVPIAEIDLDPQRPTLVSFSDDWPEATRKLIAHKSYGAAPTREAAE